MGKIQINIREGSLIQSDIIIGIDLGTTNSLAAFWNEEKSMPEMIPMGEGNNLLPSIVHISEAGDFILGNRAKEMLSTDPESTIYSVKSLIGRTTMDLAKTPVSVPYKIISGSGHEWVELLVHDKAYSPIEVSSMILTQIKENAEHHLGRSVSRCVVTVPAYFTEVQRQFTVKACQQAGLSVVRVINEPTAASLAYGFMGSRDRDTLIVVYDLGGGTFDISILRLSGGVFEVLATRGNSRLGGDDFTNAIVEFWKNRYFSAASHLLTQVDFIAHLNKLAEESKRAISAGNSFSSHAGDINIQLDRSILDELINPLVIKTIECCQDALKDAAIELSDIDEVIMVGGATRTPLVREMAASFFQKKLNISLSPDEVVASGAAIQAAIIAGHVSEFLLLDVTPLAIGIEIGDGLMDVLIPRNSKIPCTATRLYTTQKDGQSGIRISVFQGGYTQVAKNLKIAEFTLNGIPLMPAGTPRIQVTFSMDSSGMLTVTALEQLTGISQNIQISSTLLMISSEEQAAPL